MKWAPLIPLIGGFPLGCEKAFGKPPNVILSYSGFEKNDSHYVHYQNNILGRDIEYRKVDENASKQNIDVIVGTPPLNLAA